MLLAFFPTTYGNAVGVETFDAEEAFADTQAQPLASARLPSLGVPSAYRLAFVPGFTHS